MITGQEDDFLRLTALNEDFAETAPLLLKSLIYQETKSDMATQELLSVFTMILLKLF